MKPEDMLKRLEEIAEKLEAKDVDIEEATKLFEEGVSLIKENYEILKNTSAKVVVLKQELESYKELDFDCLKDNQ